jgi:aromatic ring-cleaving dioxygenase
MSEIYGYHAHVYFDTDTESVAERLRRRLAERFPIEIGPNSGHPAGPHPVPQFQIIFGRDEFDRVVPWLMLNREGLDILIHPLTDDMVDDHSVYAAWLGTPVVLRLDTMQRRGYPVGLLPKGMEQHARAA